MSIADSLTTDLKVESALSRRVLEAVPDDKYDWKPHEKSMSLGRLAGHIAETPMWMGSMMGDVFDFAADMGDYKPLEPTDNGALLAAFDENLGTALSLLDGKDDEFMKGIWKGVKGEEEIMVGPRHQIARAILVHHSAHHRGQLTVYLRLLGVPVPPTYGPTADSEDWS